MPHKFRPLAFVNFRPKHLSALVAALVLAFAVAPPGDSARAQRRRTRPAASQQGANSNAAAGPQRAEPPKRVFVGQGSSTAQGSRQTIKSDNPLNDYSA